MACSTWRGRVVEWDDENEWVEVQARDAQQAADLVAYARVGDADDETRDSAVEHGITVVVWNESGAEKAFAITVEWEIVCSAEELDHV